MRGDVASRDQRLSSDFVILDSSAIRPARYMASGGVELESQRVFLVELFLEGFEIANLYSKKWLHDSMTEKCLLCLLAAEFF